MNLPDPLALVVDCFDRAGLEWVIIGGHAVNSWLEPRFTADIDITVAAGPEALARVVASFEDAGFAATTAYGEQLESGPDFVRLERDPSDPPIEIQTAKTALQSEVLSRAVRLTDGTSVATPEDLIVLKLIAYRAKDRIDLDGLTALPDLDWKYVARWAEEWEVEERLADLL